MDGLNRADLKAAQADLEERKMFMELGILAYNSAISSPATTKARDTLKAISDHHERGLMVQVDSLDLAVVVQAGETAHRIDEVSAEIKAAEVVIGLVEQVIDALDSEK